MASAARRKVRLFLGGGSPTEQSKPQLLGQYEGIIYVKVARATKPIVKTFEVHIDGELTSIQRSREVAPLVFAINIKGATDKVAVRFANEMPFFIDAKKSEIPNLKKTQPDFLKDIGATHRARTRVLNVHFGDNKIAQQATTQTIRGAKKPKIALRDKKFGILLPDELQMLTLQQRGAAIDPASPILICCIRNEEALLQKFIPYYRKMGIKNFIFIDNDSTDGSRDVCRNLSEGDISVYQTSEIYNEARSGIDWSNAILDYFDGEEEAWFLVLDADEYLAYPECEIRNIKEFTDNLWEKVGAEAVLTPLVDLYPKGNLKHIARIPLEEVNCFDPNQYSISGAQNFPHFQIEGGPRRRVMGAKGFALKKVALFRNMRGVRLKVSTHALSERLELAPVTGALLHYKFSASWIEKVEREKVEKRRTQAEDYMKYGQAFEEDIMFFDPAVSREYTSSQDLLDAGLMWGGPQPLAVPETKNTHGFMSLIPLLSAANSKS